MKKYINLAPKEFRVLYILLSLTYLVLATNLPVSIYTYAGFDDFLFINNSYQILMGKWLGQYNHMTLAKGPGFSFFIAISSALRLSITLSIAIFYLFSCWLLSVTLRKISLSRLCTLIIFILMLFHPALFANRVIRDDIYPALSLIIFSAVIRLVYFEKFNNSKLYEIPLFGIISGIFWLTREEGIWIIPGLLVLIVLRVLHLKLNCKPYKELLINIAVLTLSAFIFIGSIAFINFRHYGKFGVVDFKGKSFSRALNKLNSVEAGPEIPLVPVSFTKRQEIYKISPTFLKLKDYFEDKGKVWTLPGCDVYPRTCGDYAGGWFMWALRESVAIEGFYDSPVHAEEFYNNISNEIDAACNEGTIKCKSSFISFMPKVTIAQIQQIPRKIIDAIKLATLISKSAISLTGGPSKDPIDNLNMLRTFLGNPLSTISPSEQVTTLKGWYYSPAQDWISLKCTISGTITKEPIKQQDSPDIAQHFNDPRAKSQRFFIELHKLVIDSHKNDDCKIINSSQSDGISILSLDNVVNQDFKIGNSDLYIESVTDNTPEFKSLKIKQFLISSYSYILPVLAFFGFISYLYCLVSRNFTDLFFVSTSLWILFFSRIFLLVLVDISSFPAIDPLYMSAAFPILIIASMVSIWSFVNLRKVL